MSLLSGLVSRLRGLFGGSEDAAADAAEEGAAGDTTPDEPPAGPVCPVCGTRADAGAEACPLCGSTDLRAGETAEASGRGSRAADRPSPDGTVREEPSESAPPESGSEPEPEQPSGLAPDRARQTRVDGRTDDDAVDRLRQLADERRAAEAADDDGPPGGGDDDGRTTGGGGDGDIADESGDGG
jgi:ribosomal protein L40E